MEVSNENEDGVNWSRVRGQESAGRSYAFEYPRREVL